VERASIAYRRLWLQLLYRAWEARLSPTTAADPHRWQAHVHQSCRQQRFVTVLGVELPYAEATWTRGLLLVMSDNLRQAKTCFCEPQGPLQHRHSAGAAISAVHLRTVPEGLRIIDILL
jgi:hypothetical protein